MGAQDVSVDQRETENEGLKRELQALRPELQLIKSEVRLSHWIYTQLWKKSSDPLLKKKTQTLL